MADIILSPALQVIFDRLASPIIQWIGDLLGLKGNFHNLQHALSMAQAVLEDAENQQLTNKAVRTWLSKLKYAAYNAEDLLDEITARFRRYKEQDEHWILSFFDEPKSTLNAEEVRKMLHELGTIAIEGFNFHLRQGSVITSQSNRRETGSFIIDSEIYGRKEDKQRLVKLLTSSEATDRGNVTFIPIIGIGGLGKTTLAQLAYNDEKVTLHFDVKLWVFVSDEFKAKRVLKSVIESATMEKCDDLGMNVLQSKLWGLLHNKRYLIVLDDVWLEQIEEWDKLEPVFSGGMQGSKIIITARNKKAELMTRSPTFPFYLTGLTEDDCWKLFKVRAFARGDEDNYPKLLSIGKQIIKKSGGLPLVVKTLGNLMRFEKEEREWLFVQNSELCHLDAFKTGILPELRLSYLHLPPHLKHCFAFCSIFPKGYEFKKEKLIHMWMAEGFIQSNGAGKTAEDIGEDYFKDLLQMFFFQEVGDSGKSGKCKYRMHDIIHDLTRSVAGQDSNILDEGLTSGSLAQTRHSSVICDFRPFNIPEALLEAKHLRTLVLFTEGDSVGDPSELFTSFPFLRVLDLNSCGLGGYLNHSVGDLLCLRYLDLSHNPIRVLPYGALEQLPLLQTLNLFGCYNLRRLPDIAKMVSLRHLDISECKSLTTMSPLFDGIYRLYGRSSSKNAREEFAYSKYLPEMTNQLQRLPTIVVGGFLDIMLLGQLNLRGELHIRYLENVSTLNDAESANLIKKESLDSLGLYWGDKEDTLSSNFNVRDEDTGTESVRREQKHSSGPSQKHQSDANVAEEVIKGLQPHQNLKILVVKGYPGIRFPQWTLPNLTKLDLVECNRCNCLPQLGNLPLLKTLYLQRMPAVEYIGRELYGEHTERPFPLLKELVLRDFPNLQEWFAADGRNGFPSLSKLIVEKCPKLTAMPLLLSLQHLEMRECSALLINSIRSLSSLTILSVEKVEEFFSLSRGFLAKNTFLKSLEMISCPKLHILSSDFGNLTTLKSLKIHWSDELSALMHSLQNLKTLESLKIYDCRSSEVGIRGLSYLRSLSIENCSNLITVSMNWEHFTCLEHLAIKNCPSLVSLPEDLHHLSALRSLGILSCPLVLSLPEELQYVTTLHCLEIRSCTGLTALPGWVGKIASLKSLTISNCQNLKELPDCLKGLAALQHLSIQDCPEIEERCKQKFGDGWSKISHVSRKSIR